jgi:hypothetical protein
MNYNSLALVVAAPYSSSLAAYFNSTDAEEEQLSNKG